MKAISRHKTSGDVFAIKTDEADPSSLKLCRGEQIRKLEMAFIDEGGFTERLYRVRSEARGKKSR
ncbi:MAG: hypothetical protein ISS71_08690 [Phycisphaerae bacterium]|nr:hypothetical protein [Phycisphaerae bacterium]